MFVLARTAQVVSLIVAVFLCHGVSTDARPGGFSAAIEAHEDGAADVQIALEYNSESKPELGSLPQLAMLTPEQSKQIEERPPTTVEPLSQPIDRSPTNAEPFSLPTMTALPNEVSAKWATLRSRLLSEEKMLVGCRTGEYSCPAAARRLLSIVELGRQRESLGMLGRINRAVNLSIRPVSDWAQYGIADYWATPLETLGSGAGDCEDYAIVKYVVLRESGIAADDLRLLVVRDIKNRENHAVLAVRYNGEWLILDNRTLVMVNADEALHYYPLFALDQRGVRTFVTAIAAAERVDIH